MYPSSFTVSSATPLAHDLQQQSQSQSQQQQSSVGGPLLTSAAFQMPSYSAPPMPFFQRQTSASSLLSTNSTRYDAYQGVQPQQPTPLSTSSLDQDTVYRGVVHTAEPTLFATSPQTSLWNTQGDAHDDYAFGAQQAKKLELTYQPTSTSTFAGTSFAVPQQSLVDLPSVPSHVERFTSFYSSAPPARISKAIRIGFQTLSEMRVEFLEEAEKGKFKCQCFTDDHESIQFLVRLYRTGSAAPAPYLVEFQRRSGDSVSFFRLFQKILRSCSAIHHGPYEASFAVAGMSVPPLSAASGLAPPCLQAGGLAMPNLAGCGGASAIQLDLPSVASLCSMVASDCIESKRGSAKMLAQVSQSSDLFPPTLARQTSSPATIAASKAIWSAIVNILTSGDSECARLGAAILSNCLKRGDVSMLLEYLEQDHTVIAHLVQRLAQAPQPTDLAAREIRRLIAVCLSALAQKKGHAYLQRFAPNAPQVLASFHTQQ